jgi:hypothetical protein
LNYGEYGDRATNVGLSDCGMREIRKIHICGLESIKRRTHAFFSFEGGGEERIGFPKR